MLTIWLYPESLKIDLTNPETMAQSNKTPESSKHPLPSKVMVWSTDNKKGQLVQNDFERSEMTVERKTAGDSVINTNEALRKNVNFEPTWVSVG